MSKSEELRIPLAEWLEAKGLRPVWLARQAGASRASVSHWCSGQSKPTRYLSKIQAITGLTADQLLNWDQVSANPHAGRLRMQAQAARPAA